MNSVSNPDQIAYSLYTSQTINQLTDSDLDQIISLFERIYKDPKRYRDWAEFLRLAGTTKLLRQEAAKEVTVITIARIQDQIKGALSAHIDLAPKRISDGDYLDRAKVDPGLVFGHIDRLYVTPEQRGQGVARELYRRAEVCLISALATTKSQVATLLLNTHHDDLSTAGAFWQKMGYQNIGYFHDQQEAISHQGNILHDATTRQIDIWRKRRKLDRPASQ